MPAACAPIVFRTAAGPRIGYGHLVRTAVLGRALGVTPVVSVRGTRAARQVARQWRCEVTDGGAAPALAAANAALLVIDDPSSRASQPWARAAMRRGMRVATMHDLGLAPCATDLAIDGSIVRPHALPTPSLLGPRFLVLDATPSVWREPSSPSVVIALGGGPRRRVALALARAIRARRPDVAVSIAGGRAAAAPTRLPAGVTWLGPRRGLAADFARATVVVVGGGLSLYDACRIGAPAVGLAVVPAQRPTIAGLAARRAVVDGGSTRDLDTAVRRVVAVLRDADRRARLSRAGRALVDGRGADRVAAHLRRLAGRRAGPRPTGGTR
jgi:spore coat polysaccharide biosynthesis predicted glycosyltransferase SpsG